MNDDMQIPDPKKILAALKRMKEKRLSQKWDEWIDRDGQATAVLVKTSDFRIFKGARHVTGPGGGLIVFLPDGNVHIRYAETAILAASFGSGSRSMKITEHPDKKQPPILGEIFEMVSNLRRTSLQGFPFEDDPSSPKALKQLDVFRTIAWKLLRAVSDGDSDLIEDFAKALKEFERIRSEEAHVHPWQEIAGAIGSAAKEAKDVPNRSRVVEHYLKANSDNSGEIRDKLNRMGFGWLPAPQGRPPKVKSLKPG